MQHQAGEGQERQPGDGCGLPLVVAGQVAEARPFADLRPFA